jgi:hypothetical protein
MKLMADTTDIGGSFSQIGGSSGVVPPSSVTPTTTLKNTGFSSQDSLSASELSASLALMWTMNAQTPVLSPPSESHNISATSGVSASGILSMAGKFHEIVMNVLDSWNDSIKKQAEEARQSEKSPSRLAKLDTERRNRLGLIQTVKNYADQLKVDHNQAMLGSLTSALVITGAFIGIAATNTVNVASTLLVAVTPQINFAVDYSKQAVSGIGDDFRAQLGLLGAWAMGTMMHYSTVDILADKINGKPVDERVLADKYATKVLQLINSNQLNQFISGMLANKTDDKGQPLTDERREQLSAILKLVLLSSALAAVYKSKTGKITAQEFLDLVNGKMRPEDGVEKQLVSALADQMKLMLPDEKAKILNALSDYMDSDPKLKSFLDVGKTFDDINETLTLSPGITKT